ncbi:MAG: TolC family protein [Lentisphaeraceae bacterium]|nr:TolC family protein [Lentisphaeraceae bacterium]
MKNISKALSGILSFIFLVSCQTYQPLELDSKKILKEVTSFRNVENIQTTSFADLAMLMSERNNNLKLLRNEYKKHKSIAELATPWPNPEITIGPAFGSQLGKTSASSTQPFLGFGFSIPLGSRLLRQDDINNAREIQAHNELILEHRSLYFQLKKSYISIMVNQQKNDAINELITTLSLSRKITKKLIEFGTSTKLGLTQIDIQIARLKLRELDLRNQKNLYLQKLANLLNIDLASLRKIQLATKTFDHYTLPRATHLKELMLNNNASLSRQELSFHMANKKLRLELTKQYPDLKFGLSQEQEVGEDRRILTLPFSIKLPFFDQNQQSIASSVAQREIELQKYKQKLSLKLSLLESQIQTLNLVQQKYDIIENKILPLAKTNSKDAETALKLGSIDTLRYLDLLAQHQEFKLNKSEINEESWQILIAIEVTTGTKLFHLDVDDPHKFENPLKTLEVKK